VKDENILEMFSVVSNVKALAYSCFMELPSDSYHATGHHMASHSVTCPSERALP